MGYPTAKERSALEVRAETFAGSVRTDTFMEMWKDILQGAEEIESKWKRWGAFFLLALFGIAGLFSIMMFPAFEDQILDAASRTHVTYIRNVRPRHFLAHFEPRVRKGTLLDSRYLAFSCIRYTHLTWVVGLALYFS